MLFSGTEFSINCMTRGPGIAANEAVLSLILKRTGEVLLMIFRILVNCPNEILIFYQYNIVMTPPRGGIFQDKALLVRTYSLA